MVDVTIYFPAGERRGSYANLAFFKKYFPWIYTKPLDTYDPQKKSFVLWCSDTFVKRYDPYYYIVGPDQKFVTRKAVTNNKYFAKLHKIPFMYVPNEFFVDRKQDGYGTYLTPNTTKVFKFLEWFEENEVYPFYVMCSFKDAIKIKKRFPQIVILKDREKFFSLVKYVKYFIVDDWFEFCPNFIKESLNCGCSIELIGKIPDGCGAKYLIDNYDELNDIEQAIETWEGFITSHLK